VETVNQIIVTLKEADTFARSLNPHHHRLAIVLLDNIIELQLRRKAETAFAWDRTTAYSGVRQHDRKRRKSVTKYHADLLALTVSESIISEDESNLLAFAHRIRNRAYHEGDSEDRVDLRLGITLLYRFVRKHFPAWKNGWSAMRITPDPAIPVEDVSNDKSGMSPLLFGFEEDGHHNFQSESHWLNVLGACLKFDDSIDLRPLIKRRIDNLIESIDGWLCQITEDDNINFILVLAQRFSVLTHMFGHDPRLPNAKIGPVGALNIYLAVLDQEERLLDIEDETERDQEFQKLVKAHKFQKDVISSLDLDKYRSIADSVTEGTESEGITQFFQIEEELKKVRRAAHECSSDLDNHLQLELDIRRGK
jgi:hypothetical protein